MDDQEIGQRVHQIQGELFAVTRLFIDRIKSGEPDVESNIYMAVIREIKRLDPKLIKEVVPSFTYHAQEGRLTLSFHRIQ